MTEDYNNLYPVNDPIYNGFGVNYRGYAAISNFLGRLFGIRALQRPLEEIEEYSAKNQQTAQKQQSKLADSHKARELNHYWNPGEMDPEDWAAWEKRHANEIRGMNRKEQEDYFRDTVFSSVFSNSKNEYDQNVWNNVHTNGITPAQRNYYMLAKGITGEDVYNTMTIWDQNGLGQFQDDSYAIAGKGTDTWEGLDDEESHQASVDFYRKTKEETPSVYDQQIEWFKNYSREASNVFKAWEGTKYMEMNDDEWLDLMASWNNIKEKVLKETDDETLANLLSSQFVDKEFQRIMERNQTRWDLAKNTLLQALTNASGEIITDAGLTWGIMKYAGGIPLAGLSAWKKILTGENIKDAYIDYLEELNPPATRRNPPAPAGIRLRPQESACARRKAAAPPYPAALASLPAALASLPRRSRILAPRPRILIPPPETAGNAVPPPQNTLRSLRKRPPRGFGKRVLQLVDNQWL